MTPTLTSRPAHAGDLDGLARMNRALIEDEGTRNPMTPAELREQLFIRREHRRRGCGRAAFRQLTTHHFPAGAEVTLDVLATNPRGLAFWQAVGLAPYATVMRGRG